MGYQQLGNFKHCIFIVEKSLLWRVKPCIFSALLRRTNIHIDTKPFHLFTPFLLTNLFANICCFDSLCHSQQFFGQVGTGHPGLRGL